MTITMPAGVVKQLDKEIARVIVKAQKAAERHDELQVRLEELKVARSQMEPDTAPKPAPKPKAVKAAA
jgi:hypothetical protein